MIIATQVYVTCRIIRTLKHFLDCQKSFLNNSKSETYCHDQSLYRVYIASYIYIKCFVGRNIATSLYLHTPEEIYT